MDLNLDINKPQQQTADLKMTSNKNIGNYFYLGSSCTGMSLLADQIRQHQQVTIDLHSVLKA